MSSISPAYTYTVNRPLKIITIYDLFNPHNPTKSVTNGAEEVLMDIEGKEGIVLNNKWCVMQYDTNKDLGLMYPIYKNDHIENVVFGPVVPIGWRFKPTFTLPKIALKELKGRTLREAKTILPQCSFFICTDSNYPWDWKFNRVKIKLEKNKISEVIGIS